MVYEWNCIHTRMYIHAHVLVGGEGDTRVCEEDK